MDLNVRSKKCWIALILVVVVVCTVILGSSVEQPRIASVTNEWGTVTENQTEIETRLVIENPRLLEVAEPFVTVEYTVSLNTVEIAHGQTTTIHPSGKQNIINTTTWINNDDIPAWWVTHINRNQTTTVRMNPVLVLKYIDISVPVNSWTQTRVVNTNMLDPLQTTKTRRFRAFNRTLLFVNETAARWGHATARQTPIIVSSTVTNPTSDTIPIIDIRYVLRMNSVRVGHGIIGQRTVLAPNSTQTIETRAIINNSQLDEWWVTHLRHEETTRLSVDFYATIEYTDERRRVPLDFLTYNRTFQTQLLAGNTSAHDNAPGVRRTNQRHPPIEYG